MSVIFPPQAPSSCETVPVMATAWDTCVSDLRTMATAHGQASAKLKQNSEQLFVFSKEKLKDQVTKSTMARRVRIRFLGALARSLLPSSACITSCMQQHARHAIRRALPRR